MSSTQIKSWPCFVMTPQIMYAGRQSLQTIIYACNFDKADQLKLSLKSTKPLTIFSLSPEVTFVVATLNCGLCRHSPKSLPAARRTLCSTTSLFLGAQASDQTDQLHPCELCTHQSGSVQKLRHVSYFLFDVVALERGRNDDIFLRTQSFVFIVRYVEFRLKPFQLQCLYDGW